MLRGLGHLSYRNRLRAGGTQTGEKAALVRPYCSFPVFRGSCKKGGEGLFVRGCTDNRLRSNSIKLKEGMFRLDITKKFLITSMVRHWNMLSREVVDAPSLEVFKGRLNGALGNLVELEVSLLMAGVGMG